MTDPCGGQASEDPVEFLEYTPIVRELKSFGMVERPTGALMRFDLQRTPKVVPTVHSAFFGPADLRGEAGEGVRFFETPRDRLPELIEGAVHAGHVSEVVIIPVGAWGAVVNAVAFDLATDESWLEIDAEASLHQNRRDPLAVEGRDMHLLASIARSLVTNAEGPEQDLTVAATGAALLLEFSGHRGTLRLKCAHDVLIEKISRPH